MATNDTRDWAVVARERAAFLEERNFFREERDAAQSDLAAIRKLLNVPPDVGTVDAVSAQRDRLLGLQKDFDSLAAGKLREGWTLLMNDGEPREFKTGELYRSTVSPGAIGCAQPGIALIRQVVRCVDGPADIELLCEQIVAGVEKLAQAIDQLKEQAADSDRLRGAIDATLNEVDADKCAAPGPDAVAKLRAARSPAAALSSQPAAVASNLRAHNLSAVAPKPYDPAAVEKAMGETDARNDRTHEGYEASVAIAVAMNDGRLECTCPRGTCVSGMIGPWRHCTKVEIERRGYKTCAAVAPAGQASEQTNLERGPSAVADVESKKSPPAVSVNWEAAFDAAFHPGLPTTLVHVKSFIREHFLAAVDRGEAEFWRPLHEAAKYYEWGTRQNDNGGSSANAANQLLQVACRLSQEARQPQPEAPHESDQAEVQSVQGGSLRESPEQRSTEDRRATVGAMPGVQPTTAAEPPAGEPRYHLTPDTINDCWCVTGPGNVVIRPAEVVALLNSRDAQAAELAEAESYIQALKAIADQAEEITTLRREIDWLIDLEKFRCDEVARMAKIANDRMDSVRRIAEILDPQFIRGAGFGLNDDNVVNAAKMLHTRISADRKTIEAINSQLAASAKAAEAWHFIRQNDADIVHRTDEHDHTTWSVQTYGHPEIESGWHANPIDAVLAFKSKLTTSAGTGGETCK